MRCGICGRSAPNVRVMLSTVACVQDDHQYRQASRDAINISATARESVLFCGVFIQKQWVIHLYELFYFRGYHLRHRLPNIVGPV